MNVSSGTGSLGSKAVKRCVCVCVSSVTTSFAAFVTFAVFPCLSGLFAMSFEVFCCLLGNLMDGR